MSERELDLAEAIREALDEEMARDESVIVFGEDVGAPGGVFGCTRGLQQKYGRGRVRDTPISEAAIVGAGIGAALTGLRPVVEIEFVDFIDLAMDQDLQPARKDALHVWRKIYSAHRDSCLLRFPVSCRLRCRATLAVSRSLVHPHAGAQGGGPVNSERRKRGLLKTAIRDNNPTLFFEHKLMYYAKRLKRLRDEYDTIAGIVPQGDNLIPFGRADIKRAGKDVTIVATMMMVHKARRRQRAYQMRELTWRSWTRGRSSPWTKTRSLPR